MKEAISFLLNFIGRRDCNAGGRISECSLTVKQRSAPRPRFDSGQSDCDPSRRACLQDNAAGHTPHTFFTRLPVEIRGVLVYDNNIRYK
mgnify:FL=1